MNSNNKIILYGAGYYGQVYLNFLISQGFGDDVAAFCDQKACEIKEMEGKNVLTYEEARLLKIPFVVTLSRNNCAYNDVINKLRCDEIMYYEDLFDYEVSVYGYSKTDLNRAYVAFYHKNYMDQYYNDAEQKESLRSFWDEGSSFYKLFQKLDLSNVIELACGHGRHVPQYYDKAQHITLVDVLPENVDFCKKRFGTEGKISYYVNNGKDLSRLADNTYSSMFTYDAMVHFELIDVYEYLCETYRVLRKGGYALFHHSNNYSSYINSFKDDRFGRSFMSDKIFSYLAYRAGLEIVSQQVIDWEAKDLDCITLVQKIY